MSIFLNKDSKVIVQGITGGEGTKHTKLMLKAGTQIVGGVNARKAGTTVTHEDKDGKQIELPVFGSVGRKWWCCLELDASPRQRPRQTLPRHRRCRWQPCSAPSAPPCSPSRSPQGTCSSSPGRMCVLHNNLKGVGRSPRLWEQTAVACL